MGYQLGNRNYLTSAETARRLGWTPGTYRHKRSAGEDPLTPTMVSGVALYPEDEVEAYVERKRARA